MNNAIHCTEYEYIVKNLERTCDNCAFNRDGECIHKYGYMCNSHKQNREMEGKE